jgi:hypothetical protein
MDNRFVRLHRGLWAAFFAAGCQAEAQTGCIIPRVLLIVDTSTSMTLSIGSTVDTLGDGSTTYTDAVLTRSQAATPGFSLYPGRALTNLCTASATFDGMNSRLFAAKTAATNVLSTSSGIDWGLMRFSGTECPIVGTFTNTTGTCTTDFDCAPNEFCRLGNCGLDNNLCFLSVYGTTDTRGGLSCGNHIDLPLSFGGSCGTLNSAGSAACATPQSCFADLDCTGGGTNRCLLIGAGPARSCGCSGNAQCPVGYICQGLRCVYNQACRNPGGFVLVDPVSGPTLSKILPYLDGIEDSHVDGMGMRLNPELRASGPSVLAGSIRSGTAWYNAIKSGGTDVNFLLRPYALVVLTDGETCDADTVSGPAAAAGSFVAATAAGAAHANRVYVVALATAGGPTAFYDAIAHAGGTGTAFTANTEAELETALAAIRLATSDLDAPVVTPPSAGTVTQTLCQ